MINLNEFPEIQISPQVLNADLQSAIYESIKQIDETIMDIAAIDFTVYEGVGAFFSGPLAYDSQGDKRESTQDIKANHFIFNVLPTYLLAETFDHLNSSTFIIRQHPLEEYLVKVQYSEENHFRFIMINDCALILQVNGREIVNLKTLENPLAPAIKRKEEIDQFINACELGPIPHRLPSEFATPAALYKREELANAPAWVVENYRELTLSELKKLNQPFYQTPWIASGTTLLVCIYLLKTENLVSLFFCVLFFMMQLIRINAISLTKYINEHLISVRGVLKIHPKAFFSGPLDVTLARGYSEADLVKNKEYQFEVLQNSREIYQIHGLSTKEETQWKKKPLKVKLIMISVMLFFTLVQWQQIPAAFYEDESLLEKNKNYFQVLDWYLNPTPIILDDSKLLSFEPKASDIIQFNAFMICNAKNTKRFCDRLQAPNTNTLTKAEDTEQTINPIDYLGRLHQHYATLPKTNQYVLPFDFIYIPQVQSFLQFHKVYDIDESNSLHVYGFNLNEKGLALFSAPLHVNLKAYVVKVVKQADRGEEYWQANLKLTIEEEIPIAFYNLGLVIYLVLLLIALGFCVIKLKRLPSITESKIV